MVKIKTEKNGLMAIADIVGLDEIGYVLEHFKLDPEMYISSTFDLIESK